ncbi:MAG: DUF1295 domain-containing protein [Muribaculaceae bacterium]|nr:DUF1295 domain-containing protein [Muribaculaceae bacterium]
MFQSEIYYSVVIAMIVLACVVFVALQRITPGYGMTYDRKWGPAIDNRLGWVLMEAPVFIAMLLMWVLCPDPARRCAPATVVMTLLFLLHYFQRSFIFPMLIKGKSLMPLSIILSGVTFNLLNAYMIAGWFFYLTPPPSYLGAQGYPVEWLYSPLFILGVIIFFTGMAINLHSDHIIRSLRKPGDNNHYIPRGGMFRYVTSANYFGELTEWIGFAILTWSWPGLVFAIWTFANLAPRARATHRRYIEKFGGQYTSLRRRYILPFIY